MDRNESREQHEESETWRTLSRDERRQLLREYASEAEPGPATIPLQAVIEEREWRVLLLARRKLA